MVHVSRQIGNYVIWSAEQNVGPFYVRIAGEDNDPAQAISIHSDVTGAASACNRYIAGDKRRKRETIR